MEIITKIKMAAGTIIGLIILSLWLFGGLIGAFIGIAKDDALMAVLSLLIPCFGAIYTIVSAIGALFS